MNQQELEKFVKSMYHDVWHKLDVEAFTKYYHPNVVGHHGDITIYFDDIQKHILNLKKQFKMLVPTYHRIFAVNNQVSLWFSQQGVNHDGSHTVAPLETMLTYEFKDGQILEFWSMWNIDAREYFNANSHPEKFSKHEVNYAEKYKLTKRELETLYYLIRHFNPKEIASALDLSPRTIEAYIDNIRKKFNVTSTREVIAFAIDHGFAKSVPELMELAIKQGLVKPLSNIEE